MGTLHADFIKIVENIQKDGDITRIKYSTGEIKEYTKDSHIFALEDMRITPIKMNQIYIGLKVID